MSLPGHDRVAFAAAFLAVVLLATALRAPDLERRAMHTDEAVHAIKFGSLLEAGEYRYDPVDYHGPTLNYATLVPAWLQSASRLADIDERTLRAVPVSFGLALIVLLLVLMPGLGSKAVVAAATLTAVSPAMVFYSRYYIQEMLLVFFSFAAIACGYCYLRSRRAGWAACTGVSLGLMHATKETAAIAMAAMALALLLVLWARGGSVGLVSKSARGLSPRHVTLTVFVALATSALLYSSFLTHPAGVLDSYRTYAGYLDKGVAGGLHIQPWHTYLRLLGYSGTSPVLWSEALIVVLAAVGYFATWRGRSVPGVDSALVQFVGLYTLLLLGTYSLISYKTPWIVLGPLHGLILLAGVGVAAILEVRPRGLLRPAALLLLAAGVSHLGWQAWVGSHRTFDDPRNPYVYSHPTDDVKRIARRVEAIAEAHPDGHDMRVDVISPGGDYWPLPWYLRSLPNVGWWTEVRADVPAAPVILAPPALQERLFEKLYLMPPPGERHLYVPLLDEPAELRPGVEIRGYVTSSVWNLYERRRAP